MTSPVRVRKTFKYKLMPTPAQATACETVLWRCRELYNAALQERRDAWQKCGVSVTFAMQSAQLPGVKEVRPEYRDLNAQVLQDVLHRLDKAFQAFFRRAAAGEAPGYPRFQGRDRYNSFTYPQVGEHGGARLDNGFLVLAKIGRIAVRWSRPLEGTPKTVTICREADGWYVALLLCRGAHAALASDWSGDGHRRGAEGVPGDGGGRSGRESAPLPPGGEAAGQGAAAGESRGRRGATGARRRWCCWPSAHQTVKRQRADHHHKTALLLVRQYDMIYHEAIQPANLSRRPAPYPMGTAGICRTGPAARRASTKASTTPDGAASCSILACKAACAGKRVEAVNPAYTSQDCSGCGARVPKSLSVRTHVCPSCGLVLDRDANAARNIQRAGQARQGAVAVAAVVN